MPDPLVTDIVDQALEAACSVGRRADAETSGWSDTIWDVAAEIGMPWISVPERYGGVGGSLGDAIAVLEIVGRHAAPLPIAESGVLAGWLLSSCDLAMEPGVTTAIPPRRGNVLVVDARSRLSGRVERVPWARFADHVVGLAIGNDGNTVVVRFPAAEADILPGENVAGEPRDTLVLDRVRAHALAVAPAGVSHAELRARGALTRVALISGALARVSTLTNSFTHNRFQFGRPLQSFQAVQAHIVCGAQQAALVALATQGATSAIQRGARWFELPAAKILANDAATTAAAAAHQVHGAIGITLEYPLQLHTRRLWSWREEYGNSAFWAEVLGCLVADHGADELYPIIAGGSSALSMHSRLMARKS
ncbi:hypothetical protein BST36_08270 [Mycolicibacterium moriokaense]|jgi:acyl-CoA dehydrogenase|uniref:Acyl-CoA dehydrogenase n=1 Tax=Mycolicibacterium moriokaense TaxID=39691 RepID=A0AAD1HGZ0_9MYCO|nr:acyl-CoA dehydrogenase family protein [Mycolicibacterium moriokaense]MCV7041972.1 acyl-CoA/acyl-ACP dehydrogenase [Mycolicibacterium moriokaense]ORB25060.1 hypothetical protein BST36_08270 [Mycolicibacterium moriokaense]BBX04739.1 acyl-CoA dehydrogenase [Mycolicibacterium moriokaense]